MLDSNQCIPTRGLSAGADGVLCQGKMQARKTHESSANERSVTISLTSGRGIPTSPPAPRTSHHNGCGRLILFAHLGTAVPNAELSSF